MFLASMYLKYIVFYIVFRSMVQKCMHFFRPVMDRPKSTRGPFNPCGVRFSQWVESPVGSGTWSPQGPRNARSCPCHIRDKQNAKLSECAQHKIKTLHSFAPPLLSWVTPPWKQSPCWSCSFCLFVNTSSTYQLLILNTLPHPIPIPDTYINPTPILYLFSYISYFCWLMPTFASIYSIQNPLNKNIFYPCWLMSIFVSIFSILTPK